jgi:uncharacterized protein YfaS (alpha-2-macroglobulin family)
MRGIVRTALPVLGILLTFLGGPDGLGEARAAERRIIVTPESDYAGFDTRTLKAVTLDACKKACIDDLACRAFTFNTKAGWCFLKNDNGPLASFAGATAGRIVESVDFTPTVEQQRKAELDFTGSYFDESRDLAANIKRRFDPAGAGYLALRDLGTAAYRGGSYDRAAGEFGKALAVADESAAAWRDFGAASLARNPENWSEKQEALTDATAAAINAYMRADTPGDRALALSLMGDGFAKREAWKPSWRAYRASLAIREDANVRAAYDKVIAEHGFRILSHEVDADVAQPRICVVFSEDLPVSRADLPDFVTVEGGSGLAIEPQQRQICIDGVEHGVRYKVRVRGGLPSADGEVLAQPVDLDIFVRDRAPWVGFAGNAYVLPAGQGASIPIVSVNTDKAKAVIYRIGDRALAGQLRDGDFLRQLDRYTASRIGDAFGEKVWEGEIGITSKLNETITTAIPISDAVNTLKPGAYVITAKPATDNAEWGAIATQWFVVSDMGLTSLSGEDGVHVIARSLSSAQPIANVKVRMVASNNEILGEAVTDGTGYARFDPGLARGTGGMAPQLIDAETAAGDYSFLDLSRSAFDLTDRGVDGRPAPGPLDVFLSTERGIYRPGETVYLTALVRNDRADAVGDLPLTLVIERPDGVEFARKTLSDGGAGGYTAGIPLDDDAMRGSWHATLFSDPKGAAIADTALLVEDFEPERLAFDITTAAKAFSATAPISIDLTARYLYGATAPGLSIEGDVEAKPVDTLAAFPGYKFGLADDPTDPQRQPFETESTTGEDGKATFEVSLPELPASTKPYEAKVIVRLTDTNGRAVERNLSLPVAATAPRIGIKPLFDGDVAEGGPARFEIITVAPDGTRIATGVKWTLERIETDYQWYRTDGNWRYEPITQQRRVDGGTIDTKADGAVTVAGAVDWGQYRLTVSTEGASPTATSVNFNAGWYVAASGTDTPDVLQVALDKPAYRIGETAKLRLDPRFAGIALITVVDNRLIAMKSVEVPAEGMTVDLDVTDQWGPGAYVTASLYRPMDIPARRMPARALGLTWAKIAPGDRQLAVSVDAVDEMRPRGPMAIPVTIDNLQAGEQAYVTVAAVDLGILNLTNFQPPAPDDWYFGQRKLGVEIRDLYGLLIDRMEGIPGTVRSGGDGGAVRLQAPPPTQKLIAFYSGIQEVGADGKVSVTFDLPDFNGTVRVMTIAWTKTAVGHAVKDVIVRDPVVVTASIPRFMATGDSSRLLVEINNVAGPAGDYRLAINADAGIGVAATDVTRAVPLSANERTTVIVPITAAAVGDHQVTVTLTGPDGTAFPQDLMLGVRPPGLPVTRRNIVALNAGGTLTVNADALAEFVPGTASVALSVGGASRLDVAGILAALDRYPYGCAEQLTSRALPLVYLDDVAISVGIASDAAVHERVQTAIAGVLAKQSASGAFGLWGPVDTGDMFLDAYVTDFLTRAADKGYDVPKVAKDLALDNLANSLSYAPEFDRGGEAVAYALYVLARTGRAAIGDLRYYGEAKLSAFSTPLAKAQVGAALALYGDQRRANAAFGAALADLNGETEAQAAGRDDYGTVLRDQAAVLTLAAETKAATVDIKDLATRIAASAEAKRHTSTQENAWMLLAANALIKDAQKTSFAIDGAQTEGPLYKRYDGAKLAAAPVVIENRGAESLDAVVATTGIPATPEPAGGNGFTIARAYYTPDGEERDIATIAQNDRVIVVVTVTASESRAGKVLIVDPIPAGFEIENPNISASGDTANYGWLDVVLDAAHTEARTDRFVAALNRSDSDPQEYSVAYSMRAVSPGKFAAPAATVEDMYFPELQANSGAGTVEVVGPTR